MINYVNNSFDKVLKPCDAQQFSILVNSQQTEQLILGHRGGEEKAKAKLPAITYMGVLDSDKYRKYLDRCRAQGTKPQGSRRAEFMRPTGLLMLDFDHVEEAKKLFEQLSEKMGFERLALAHITPSGKGLRLVLKRERGKTIEQEQYEFCKAMDVKVDAVCKDISRLSFVPMQREILYFNPDLLFGELPDPQDYPDGSIWTGTPSNSPSMGRTADIAGVILSNAKKQSSLAEGKSNLEEKNEEMLHSAQHDKMESEKSPEALPIEGEMPEGQRGSYGGIDYKDIVSRLEEQLGGRPERGARNAFIFTMACHLRYICNDDADWVASILPTYGEEPQKHRMTIQSAINRPMSRTMPEPLQRALRIETTKRDTAQYLAKATPPPLPTVLPEPIALLTSRTPECMRPAVAMAVFPPLGAHLYKTEFVYVDNRPYEATFMTLLMAELSSGKSAVNKPIEYIIADMRARDLTAREREREWKETCATASNAKDKPKRPDNLGVQVLTSDMTNAAFVQRLADAKGRFLYTQMDEVELLDALKTNGRAGSVSQIIRLAFDRGLYGQERVGATSVNEQVQVRWNWNASTTVQRGRSYLRRSLADGTLSRISFATIVRDTDDWGRNIPRYGDYGEDFARELQPYIDALNLCRGTIHSPEAEAWAERMLDEQLTHAEQSDDRAYATLSFRAVLMGFLRAMTLYVMCGMQWTDEISEFAAWTVRYDMWCKMHFFGDLLHQDLEAEANAAVANPRNLLGMLPHEFTRQDAQELRIAQGRNANPKNMLAQWTHRGYITYDEQRGVYVKSRA